MMLRRLRFCVLLSVVLWFVPGVVYGAAMDDQGNTSTSLSSNYDNHDVRVVSDVTAEQLDAKLKGALAGKGSMYVEVGKANGLDPAFLAALSIAETGNGSSEISKSPFNNVGGITCGSATNCGTTKPGGTKWRKFDSVDDSIKFKAELLKKNYVDAGLVTLVKIRDKYAPLGAGNDPNNLNTNWVKNVGSHMKSFGVSANSGGGETKDTSGGDVTYSDGKVVGSYFMEGELQISNVGVDDRKTEFSNVNEYGAYVFGGKIGNFLFSIAQVLSIVLLGIITFYWLLAFLSFGGLIMASELLHKLTFGKVDVYVNGFGQLAKYTGFAFIVIVVVISGLIPGMFALVYHGISELVQFMSRFQFM